MEANDTVRLCVDKHCQPYCHAVQAGESFKDGIKEVVGWIDKPCPHTGGLEEQQMRAMDCPRCWEDAKKEWGIE